MSYLLKFIAVLLAVVGIHSAGSAQPLPTGPVRIVVPAAPGGTVDSLSRKIAQLLSASSQRQFIVENRPGANGIVASKAVADANPDGATLLMTSNTHTINETLVFKGSGGLGRSFEPVAFVGYYDFAIVVPPNLQVADLNQFILMATAYRRMSYSSPGPGSPQHMAIELFKASSRTDFVHVPYRGGSDAQVSLLTGQVQMSFETVVPEIVALVQSGRIRGLATTGKTRSSLLQQLPTVKEANAAGLREYEAVLWFGLLAPAGTPREIIDRLNIELRNVMSPEVILQFKRDGANLVYMTPEEFNSFLREDTEKWGKLISRSGLRLE